MMLAARSANRKNITGKANPIPPLLCNFEIFCLFLKIKFLPILRKIAEIIEKNANIIKKTILWMVKAE